jgi:hypothetical protein
VQYLNFEVRQADGGYTVVASGQRIKGIPVFKTAAMARSAMMRIRWQFRKGWNHAVNYDAGIEDANGNPI